MTDYSGIEAITPEACRQHFLKISGEPNDPPLNVAEQVPQQVNTELDREPTFEEFVKTLHEMKVSAPGDEITVDMIETAPIPIQECILRLLVKMWQEADNEGEQEHWSPAVHKAVVLMLYKRKGDFRSFGQLQRYLSAVHDFESAGETGRFEVLQTFLKIWASW